MISHRHPTARSHRPSLLAACGRALLLAGLALAAGCPDPAPGADAGTDAGAGATCRARTDCRSGYYCAGPNERRPCGVPPRQRCDDDSGCGGDTCHAIADSCSPDGIGSECGPPCSGASCGGGLRCSAAGACEPIPCDEGFACPSHQRCDAAAAHAPGPVHARTSGCVDIPCAGDAACPAGKACVNAVCQDGPGTCREDIPVP